MMQEVSESPVKPTNLVHYDTCPICGSNELKPFLKVRDHSISKEEFELQQCTACTFVFTQDVPTEDTIGPYYESEDYISHSNTNKGLINRLYQIARSFMLGMKRKAIARGMKGRKGKLLDLGAGTGFFLDHMRQHGWQVEGIEPSDSARAFCEKEFGFSLKPTTALFELEDDQFDVISMWHVLEHVHDLNGYMKKLHALLKKQGKLYIALPNLTSYDARHYGAYWAAYDVPRHLWHFSPKTIAALGSKHGFKVTKELRMPLDAFYVSMLSEKYKEASLGVIRGGIHGEISYLNSWGGVKQCSSVIYVMEKAS